MSGDFQLSVVSGDKLDEDQQSEILSMCQRAYQEDLESLFDTFIGTTHILGQYRGSLVSHALWVTRWLQCGDNPPFRTAYVEFVATDPDFQGRGYASAVMQRLAEAIVDFELGALCPAAPDFYLKLGWQFWKGPLYIRTPSGLLATPEEKVMILPLLKTPLLDLEAPLSAEWREGELW